MNADARQFKRGKLLPRTQSSRCYHAPTKRCATASGFLPATPMPANPDAAIPNIVSKSNEEEPWTNPG